MPVYVTDPFRWTIIAVLVLAVLVVVGMVGPATIAAVGHLASVPTGGDPASWATLIAGTLALDFGSLFAFLVPIGAAAVPIAMTAVSYRTIPFEPLDGAAEHPPVTRTSELSGAGKAAAIILLVGGVLNLGAIIAMARFEAALIVFISEAQFQAISAVVMVSLAFQATYFVQLMGLRPGA